MQTSDIQRLISDISMGTTLSEGDLIESLLEALEELIELKESLEEIETVIAEMRG